MKKQSKREKMEWDDLLVEKRYHFDDLILSNGIDSNKQDNNRTMYITCFQDDIERLVYSSAFRRLQGKTQVQPFPATDYIRNRLTHSIEVAHVGRVLGKLAAYWLKEKEYLPDNLSIMNSIPDIVHGACLAHDLGNPPFGHVGEYAIQNWFKNNNGRKLVSQAMKNAEWKSEFENFDGNAQGFRIITKLQNWSDRGGLRLTFPILGTFMKYPYTSIVGNNKYGNKKFGVFMDDMIQFREICEKLRLIKKGKNQNSKIEYCRHPLSFLSEAADDICYLTTDIEDGVKSNIIDFNRGEELLINMSMDEYRLNYSRIDSKNLEDKISYLRSSSISSLIHDSILSFFTHYDSIMRGDFKGNLLDYGNFSEQIIEIREECKNTLYVEKVKMEIEASGYNVINGLFDKFADIFEAYLKNGYDGLDMHQKSLYSLLPNEIKTRLTGSEYNMCRVLVDFISGMTDSFSVEMYQKLNGMNFIRRRVL